MNRSVSPLLTLRKLILLLVFLAPTSSMAAPPDLTKFKPFVASPPYRVLVNGVSREVNIGGVPRHHKLGGIQSFINPLTGVSDVATILAGSGASETSGVYSTKLVQPLGVPGRAEVIDSKTMIAYRAGDFPVSGTCRTQISSFPVPSRLRMVWDLEFSLAENSSGPGWPYSKVGEHPVLIWQLKPPGFSPSISLTVDTNPYDARSLSLIFGRKTGTKTSRVGQINGMQRNQPVSVIMEAYLDEREAAAGGQGFWRVWVNGILVVNSTGATLVPEATEPHQWFLATYLYRDTQPLSDSWVMYWSKARLLVPG